ncbi:MAG: polyprenyl synthetase family protein [Chloroflexi bacterium]|nr:polyprenyl synthetase family protein [Chloroflexota bacterium]
MVNAALSPATLLEQHEAGMLPAVEQELKDCVAAAEGAGLGEYAHMLAYHLGWEGEDAGPKAQGKRVRPMLLLLSAASAGGDWRVALPAAAAVELVHNFSLIHDDIQDNSALRRGRATLWTKWNVAQAINAGDALFALAHLALERLDARIPPAQALAAHAILPRACLALTKGQYLDLSYEGRADLTAADYWPMIQGKTAALLAACAELGALLAGADADACRAYACFGEQVGLAFQVYDDYLGIWGDAALTGKSAESDLLAGKKSLPVLYALGQAGDFAARWAQGPLTAAELPALTLQLEVEGAREFVQHEADRLTRAALAELHNARPEPQAGAALEELARRLITRKA